MFSPGDLVRIDSNVEFRLRTTSFIHNDPHERAPGPIVEHDDICVVLETHNSLARSGVVRNDDVKIMTTSGVLGWVIQSLLKAL